MTTNIQEYEDIYIRNLAILAEYREPKIKNHLERIKRYCEILCDGLGLPENTINQISVASQLHDVGKASISEEIKFKSGELTNEEWKLSKTHVNEGYKFLGKFSSPIFNIAQEIAISHHERWNGSGYPNGLSKEKIPLSGRIVGVIDTFDALTSNRNYKKKISPFDGLDLVNNSKGKLFDPKIVEILNLYFVEILKVFDEVK